MQVLIENGSKPEKFLYTYKQTKKPHNFFLSEKSCMVWLLLLIEDCTAKKDESYLKINYGSFCFKKHYKRPRGVITDVYKTMVIWPKGKKHICSHHTISIRDHC